VTRSVSRHERHNRRFWDADADAYQARHDDALRAAPEAWGVWRIPESEIGVLGDVGGLDVLELGCGAAQWSFALAGRGARFVALDQSLAQLAHAADRARRARARLPLLGASAEAIPCSASSFDLVFCDHGALSFCDPVRALPEAARVLRPGGRLVFCHSTPWPYLAYRRRTDRVGRRLRRSYFGLRVWDDPRGTFDFVLPTGEWVRALRGAGLAIDDLVELRAPEHAATTYDWDPAWARRWPAEQIWVASKP
jgi:SAM-dependent methyltransferase